MVNIFFNFWQTIDLDFILYINWTWTKKLQKRKYKNCCGIMYVRKRMVNFLNFWWAIKSLDFSKLETQWWKFLSVFFNLQEICQNFILIPTYKYGLHPMKICWQVFEIYYSTAQGYIRWYILWQRIFNITPGTTLARNFALSIVTDVIHMYQFIAEEDWNYL